MPMFFSMNQGGITVGLSRRAVLIFIAFAHGRASSYVRSDIGATDPGRWQPWQLRCRIGATSFVKVTSRVPFTGACATICAAEHTRAAARTDAATVNRGSVRRCSVMAFLRCAGSPASTEQQDGHAHEFICQQASDILSRLCEVSPWSSSERRKMNRPILALEVTT